LHSDDRLRRSPVKCSSVLLALLFSPSAGPVTAGIHELSVENRHLPTVSAYLINAALRRSGSVQVTRQKRNADQSVSEIEFTSAGARR
jgi:hypothetical protein